MRVAILGQKKSALAFKALGIETFGISSKEDLAKAKEKIFKDNLAILFITEDIAKNYHQEIEEFYQKTLPAVLLVPGVSGKSEMGKQGLKRILERALGSDIIS